MSRFGRLAFTEDVKALQERYGSRAGYATYEAGEAAADARIGAQEMAFIESRDSFYLATVNSDGWPYIQHRGGPRGFLKVLTPLQLAFADYAGNKQYVTLGNAQTNDRVAMFLMDYPTQSRLKILGHLRTLEKEDEPSLYQALRPSDEYRARTERLFVVEISAWDWNCPQHITRRYTVEEIEEFLGHDE